MTQIYKSTISAGHKISTFFFLLFFMGMIIAVIRMLMQSPESPVHFLSSLILLVLPLLVIHCWRSQLLGLKVTDREVIIQQRKGNIVISRDDIVKVGMKDKMTWDMRIWGTDGVFGTTGWLYNKKIGTYRAFVNNGKHLVTIRTYNKCYVVNCDERDAFIDELSKN